MSSPIEFPLKASYGKQNASIEGLDRAKEIDGLPDIGDDDGNFPDDDDDDDKDGDGDGHKGDGEAISSGSKTHEDEEHKLPDEDKRLERYSAGLPGDGII